MTRQQIKERALRRAQLEAQERHVRIEGKRIAKLEAEFVDRYISEVEAFLSPVCRCASCSFARLERQIGTREAADQFARSLGITPIDVLRAIPVICEKLHSTSEAATA